MFDEPGFPGGDARESALPLLYHFVYCSRAADGVGQADVEQIVIAAQRHNPLRGITGILVHGSGVFFQWIEGPRASIESLVSRLNKDPRHHDIVPLSQSEEKRERLYPDWDMEWVDANDICEVLKDALDSADDPSNIAALKRILAHLDSGTLQSIGHG